ncbi:bacterial low temperature requirement A protein-domain-containing protein [Cunninghamella echinulata]|nr:bacterial low temperature requirement A protein-domain-containing protein [Cunninghamella echinulata]
MSAQRKGTVRRGPTMRAYRPPIGTIHRQQRNNNSDEEEFLALNQPSSTMYESDEERVELEHIDLKNKENRQSKFDGNETFGDVLSHPIEEFHAHRERHKQRESLLEAQPVHPREDYILVVHFRQLKGNQGFAMDHHKAEYFANKIGLTAQQRIQFNGVRDTDGLTAFLYKTKLEFSIKIHHKTEIAKHEDPHHHHHHHHQGEHNPNNEIVEFNDNVYVEFKPKHHHNLDIPAEAGRRPFFKYPEPDLSADIGEEKAASWLELFYDLFYVATLTQFTHTHVIKDWSTLGTYASWFVITWWAWISSSLYTSRFDTDDVVHHIWKLIEMCAVIGMAGNSEHFLNSKGYVYGYMALKGVLVIEYSIVLIVAIVIGSKSRLTLAFYVMANVVSMALWGGSLVILDLEIHRLLWYLGLLCEIVVNVIARRDKSLSWAASHLAERLGLLTLIVLGENLMSLVPFVATSSTEILMMIPNFMAVTIIFGFFFMYFEDFNKEVFLHNKYHQVWVYLHFPLHLLQVAFGISLIDTLKVYKQQMEAEGKLHKPDAAADHGTTTSGGEHGATPSTGEHGATPSTGEHGATPSTGEHGATSSAGGHGATATGTPSGGGEHGAPSTGHKLAKRAIDSIQSLKNVENDYNPMMIQFNEQQRHQTSLQRRPQAPSMYSGYLTFGKYAVELLSFTALQLISNNDNTNDYLSSSPSNASSSSLSSHHFVKRAGGAEEAPLSDEEKVFVYKTFLIFGGGIIIINSLIKFLNTRISDMNGKIIIGSRCIASVMLWALCAAPFASLDPIILLGVMMGTVILLALIDLLD